MFYFDEGNMTGDDMELGNEEEVDSDEDIEDAEGEEEDEEDEGMDTNVDDDEE